MENLYDGGGAAVTRGHVEWLVSHTSTHIHIHIHTHSHTSPHTDTHTYTPTHPPTHTHKRTLSLSLSHTHTAHEWWANSGQLPCVVATVAYTQTYTDIHRHTHR